MTGSIHDVDILLIEDNLDDATLVLRALKKCNLGNNVIHLSDGEQALNAESRRSASIKSSAR
jgi:hypothetical protein